MTPVPDAFTFSIPVLETERLVLRGPKASDFEAEAAFFETDRSAFVGGPMSRELAWRSFAAVIGHWALRGYGFWFLESKESGAFLGRVGCWFPEGWPEPEIGWTLMGDAEGKGVAYEAALASRRYAYDVLGWVTAISFIDAANVRSRALAERLGARPDGQFTHDRYGLMNIFRHPSPAEIADQEAAL